MHGYGQIQYRTCNIQKQDLDEDVQYSCSTDYSTGYRDEAEAAGGGVGGRAAARWRGRHGSWVRGGMAHLRSPAAQPSQEDQHTIQYML